MIDFDTALALRYAQQRHYGKAMIALTQFALFCANSSPPCKTQRLTTAGPYSAVGRGIKSSLDSNPITPYNCYHAG
jgi:hypothetical protein